MLNFVQRRKIYKILPITVISSSALWHDNYWRRCKVISKQ